MINLDRFDIKFAELHSAMQRKIKESVDPEAAIEDMNTKINVIMDALGLEIPESPVVEKEEEVVVEDKPVEEVNTEVVETGTETETESEDTFVVPEGLEVSNNTRKFRVDVRPLFYREVINNLNENFDYVADEAELKISIFFSNYDELVYFISNFAGVNEHDLDVMQENYDRGDIFLFGNIKVSVYRV